MLLRKNARLERGLEHTKLALEITGKAHALLKALSDLPAEDSEFER